MVRVSSTNRRSLVHLPTTCSHLHLTVILAGRSHHHHHFRDGKKETQRSQEMCPRSHEVRFQTRQSDASAAALCHALRCLWTVQGCGRDPPPGQSFNLSIPAAISSCFDYCRSLPAGLLAPTSASLQFALHREAKGIFLKRKSELAPPCLQLSSLFPQPRKRSPRSPAARPTSLPLA